jgi:hypothetical protein
MAIIVKHPFVSTVPDAADTSIVRPTNWNADHTVTGLGTAAELNAGVANGVATLDSGGKVPVSELPAAVLGALSYQGTWNASTNTPTLTSSVGTKGYYYVVSVAGNTDLNGITDWKVGDWAVYNGTAWQKVDNTDAVTSVNGYTGTVVLTQTDISGTVPTSRTLTAGTGLTGGGDLSADRTFAIDSTVATLTGTQTLTNKTLTSPKANEILDTNGNEILGLSPTTSATDYLVVKNGIGVGVPLHLYADGSSTNTGLHIQPKGTGLVTISDGTDFNKGIRFRSSGSAASAVTLLDAVATAGRVVTLPDATTTLVGRDTTDTLTNKSISGSTNTLSNIGNASLTNSAITINGTSTSLGGSINVGTVTSVDLTASTGISVSGGPVTGSGSITVTNTAPDQTVVLTAGTGISTSGTYPSFTVTNTAPDQTVALTAGTGISTSGTYPNFTITNTAPSSGGTVTSVTGTAPVVSSGGNTPAISMAAATGSVNGYLTSTDWTTFNSKAPAVTYTTNYVPYGQGTTTPALSANFTYDPTLKNLIAPQVKASNGIVVNSNTVSASYTIATGDNAMSAGPVTVASGQSVTIASGSRWVVL